MGKHTKPRRNKTTKHYACKSCNKNIAQTGSGRPKNYCSSTCNKKYNYVPKSKPNKQETSYVRNRRLILADKLLRTECVLHPYYHEGRRKFINITNHIMFCYDHLVRTTKIDTVAKLSYSTIAKLEAEMLKCQLLCHNCHAMKTYEEEDYGLATTERINQPNLFDHE